MDSNLRHLRGESFQDASRRQDPAPLSSAFQPNQASIASLVKTQSLSSSVTLLMAPPLKSPPPEEAPERLVRLVQLVVLVVVLLITCSAHAQIS